MTSIGRDLSHGWRRLRRAPGFALVATLTLALGIGANTAVFSVLDPLLLRLLPVSKPDELVLLHSAGTLQTIDISERAAFERYGVQQDVLMGVLGDAGLAEYRTSYGGVPATARGELVSSNYFSMLGVRPSEGRLFLPDVDLTGSAVVLGFNYWRHALGADPTAVGRTLIVDGVARTIVGVVPQEFLGITVESSPDFYLAFAPGSTPAWLTVIGRLNPGVSPAQARAMLEPVFNQVVHASQVPEIEQRQAMARLLVTPVPRGLSAVRAKLALPVWVLMAVVGLVLIVACANVANLLLTRATGRRHEMAVEVALGATRADLIRQLVAESAWITMAGAVAGLLAARWTSSALVASLSTRRAPVELATGLDGRVLLFTAVMLGFTILLCGVLPAFTATRVDVMHDLKARGSSPRRVGSRGRVGQVLIVGQIAVSVAVLLGAGLLVRSLVNLQTSDVGLDRDRVLSVSLADEMPTRPAGHVSDVLSQLLERTRGLPGVQAVSVSALAPFSGDELGINLAVEGARQTVASPHAFFNSVAPGYFATVGIPLVAGRDFSTDDDPASRPVAIVNRTMARRYFGDESPVGKHLTFVEGNRPPMEIVGVVADSVHNDVREPALDFVYLCRPSRPSAVRRAVMLVRTAQNGTDVAGPIRQLVHSLDAGIAVTSLKTIRQSMDESLRDDRVIAATCSTFSVLALAIAALGLYGVLSVRVARQTREIGIRIALGASTRHIVQFVTGHGMRLTLAGLVLGMAGGLASTSVLTTMLFGLHPTDPLTIGAVAVTMMAVTTVACYVPARRAMRVDPVTALRHD